MQMTTGRMTATQAAAKAGVAKSSITRAIKAGKIRAERNEFGDYEIVPEELSNYRRRNQRQPQQSSEIVADIWGLLGELVDKLAALEALTKCGTD
jgi:hypothetical protein